MKIFSITRNFSNDIYTIFGIKIKIKRMKHYFREHSLFYFLQKTNIQAASIHPKTFGEYKNKYQGKKLAIVGCGPSLKKYIPMQDVIHIGVNRAFLNHSIKLDYLFIQDYLKGGNDMELANQYRKESCIKFYGILPEFRYLQVKHNIKRLSPQVIAEAGAKTYIIEDSANRNWAENLEIEALGDWCGSIFSALQFALYTNPKEIYLVGCDCSDKGHFHSEKPDITSDLTPQKQSWLKFKEVAAEICPNTKVISVNPVGLKGIFDKDIFQGED